MIRYHCMLWVHAALLVLILLLGPLARFADAVPPLAPTAVGGKEYSNAPDETADGTPNAHQTIWWDGAGGAADMEDYTSDLPAELQRTTQMAIGAHPDDVEIMAYHAIIECFGNEEEWLTAVTVTNGAGSPRDDVYADYTDEEMRLVRKVEQKKAAMIGEYSLVALLDYPSSAVKDPSSEELVEELAELIRQASPQVISTHNLADKHDTHVGVALRTIQALRSLPTEARPEKLYGCEVWRDLDWTMDDDKVVFDVSAHENLALALDGVFDSQIVGGKRYDLATAGRRRANATYYASHAVDVATSMIFAMDLTPLIEDDSLDIGQYIAEHINRFAEDVSQRIAAVS